MEIISKTNPKKLKYYYNSSIVRCCWFFQSYHQTTYNNYIFKSCNNKKKVYLQSVECILITLQLLYFAARNLTSVECTSQTCSLENLLNLYWMFLFLKNKNKLWLGSIWANKCTWASIALYWPWAPLDDHLSCTKTKLLKTIFPMASVRIIRLLL